MKSRFEKIFLIGNFIFFVAAVVLFSYFEYQKDKTTLYRQIDEKLVAAAEGSSLLLGKHFLQRSKDASSVSPVEDMDNIKNLSTFAKSINVTYVYTMIPKEGRIVFTASSATDEELKTGKNLTRYFDEYDDASDELKSSIWTQQKTFAEYTDKWGTFRSVFIPAKALDGRLYIAAADIRIDDVHALLWENISRMVLHLFGLFLISIPFLTWRLRRINNTLKEENKTLIEDLKNGHQRLLNILWGTGAGTWEWNIQTGETRVSPEWTDMLGYTQEELAPITNATWKKLTHPDDLALAHQMLQRHFEGELDYYECEIRMRHKQGHWVWVHTRGRVVADTIESRPLLMAGVHLEITQRKEAENELRKLSQAVEQSPISIIITDLEGNIEYANSTFFTLTGYSKEEIIGQNPRLFQSGKTPAFTYEQMWEQLSQGKSWHGEFINISKDGSEFIQSVNVSPIFEADGRISHYMAIEEDITDKKHSEERIHRLANFDLLTGLPNRAQFENHFRFILNLAKRSRTRFAVMFLDLDHFKEINDSLGHRIGDAMLIESAKRLTSLMRETDIVARMGGDEFIIILSNTDTYEAETVAQKILDSISKPYKIDQYGLTISASIGIALYPSDGSSIDVLSKNADTAMYRAKKEGRNAYRFFTEEMHQKSLRSLQISNALRSALDNDELHLLYQPQLSTHDERIIGAEALLRWNHPELGGVSPAEFIPVAEDNGQILPIGEWVLRTAIQQIRRWMDEGLAPLIMSVNLSAVQFRHHDLPNLVSRILNETNVPPEYLELELTESIAMHDPQLVINVMNNLHARGIRMSIDDFGTGYSSLSYLKQFKVYKLKIDRSFVRDISTDPDDKAIVSAVIHMAQSLGLKTIAEGVETIGQLEYLRKQGCDEIQGYYYSRPLSVEAFDMFVREKNR